MKTRLALTSALAASALLLTACADDEPAASDDPTPSATTATSDAPTPTEAPSDEPSATTPTEGSTSGAASDFVGDWATEDGSWVVHFREDGTYALDVDGNETSSGSYAFEGSTVTLTGADGNDQVGTVEGENIVFDFGTLIRS